MKERIYSFDILKFICSILIIFHHFQQVTHLHFKFVNFYNGKVYLGYLVELFFIISGFITFNNLDRVKNLNFRDFYLKKYLRFFPSVTLTVLCILLLNYLSIKLMNESLLNEDPNLITILSKILLTFRWVIFNNKIGINNPLWYVSVLLLCYILLYIVYQIAKANEKKYFLFL